MITVNSLQNSHDGHPLCWNTAADYHSLKRSQYIWHSGVRSQSIIRKEGAWTLIIWYHVVPNNQSSFRIDFTSPRDIESNVSTVILVSGGVTKPIVPAPLFSEYFEVVFLKIH